MNPVGKGLTILHDLTASHECWHGSIFKAINEIHPHCLVTQHSLLLQLECAEFNSKKCRLWHETSQALPFKLLLNVHQAIEHLLASISSPVNRESYFLPEDDVK